MNQILFSPFFPCEPALLLENSLIDYRKEMFQFLAVATLDREEIIDVSYRSKTVPFNFKNPILAAKRLRDRFGKHRLIKTHKPSIF